MRWKERYNEREKTKFLGETFKEISWEEIRKIGQNYENLLLNFGGNRSKLRQTENFTELQENITRKLQKLWTRLRET